MPHRFSGQEMWLSSCKHPSTQQSLPTHTSYSPSSEGGTEVIMTALSTQGFLPSNTYTSVREIKLRHNVLQSLRGGREAGQISGLQREKAVSPTTEGRDWSTRVSGLSMNLLEDTH